MGKTGRERTTERESRAWERLVEKERRKESVEHGKDWERENEGKRESRAWERLGERERAKERETANPNCISKLGQIKETIAIFL